MPTISNTAEGGTNGTTVTTGNSGGGSGTACSTVTVGATATLQFSNVSPAPLKGSMSFYMAHASSEQTVMWWALATTSRTVLRTYWRFTGAVSAQDSLLSIRHSSGNMVTLVRETTDKLIIQNAAGANITASRSTNALVAGTTYRIEVEVNKGTGTNNGLLGYAYYVGDSSTAEFSWTASNVNAGTADVSHVRLGRNTAVASAATYWYDDMQAQDLASGWIGPSSTAATVDAVAAAVTAASPVPGVAGGAVVGAVAATVAASAPVPDMSAGCLVQAVPAAVSVAAPAPTVGGGATLGAVAATVSVAAPSPEVSTSGGVTVQAVPAPVTAQAMEPSVAVGTAVQAVPAGVSAGAPAPVVSGAAGVQALAAVAVCSAPDPAVSGGAVVQAVPAAVTVLTPSPAAAAGALILAAPALVTVAALPPTVATLPPRDLVLAAAPLAGRWGAEPLTARWGAVPLPNRWTVEGN